MKTKAQSQEKDEFSVMRAIIREAVKQIRKKCSGAMKLHPREFKKEALTIFRESLPPFRGRPPDGVLNRAEELHNQGYRGIRLVRKLHPESADWNKETLFYRRQSINAALRSRRRKARQKAQEMNTPEKESGFIASSADSEPTAHSGHEDQDP